MKKITKRKINKAASKRILLSCPLTRRVAFHNALLRRYFPLTPKASNTVNYTLLIEKLKSIGFKQLLT